MRSRFFYLRKCSAISNCSNTKYFYDWSISNSSNTPISNYFLTVRTKEEFTVEGLPRHSVDRAVKHQCNKKQFQTPIANTDAYKGSLFPQTTRNWNAHPDSLISSAEVAEDCVAEFTSLVRGRD